VRTGAALEDPLACFTVSFVVHAIDLGSMDEPDRGRLGEGVGRNFAVPRQSRGEECQGKQICRVHLLAAENIEDPSTRS
jgi:hypothetical protein